MTSGKNSILWFRKGLRLHDNPALREACREANHLYPIFILDPFFLNNAKYRVGVNRYKFLLESLEDLHSSLQRLGSRLVVLRGKPEDVFPRIFKEWSIAQLCFETDTEPYALKRDAAIQKLAEAAHVEVFSPISHTLYDTEWLVQQNGGHAPITMQAFTKLVDRVGEPPLPVATPAALPAPASGAKGAEADATQVPSLKEMGYEDKPTTVFRGGESEALKRMEQYLSKNNWVASFEKPKTDPSAFLEPATTVLSPYLKFGCLSARLFHQQLMHIYRKSSSYTKPPVSLRGQLLWREFFYTIGKKTLNYERMEGNSICKQIPWENNEALFEAWRQAKTGYPWIDAIMVQLHQWGWMHHLARHAVACFLTRGDLYVSWEKGRDVFEELLIDQDHFVNNGNWMWLSASAFFSQYYRVYSPVTFGKKYDADGKYVRHFLPQLKDFPSKYIYEPWTAPMEVQKRCNCIIGKDYPFPIVDHTIASKANMAKMKAAYAAERDGINHVENGQKGLTLSGQQNIQSTPTNESPFKKQKTLK